MYCLELSELLKSKLTTASISLSKLIPNKINNGQQKNKISNKELESETDYNL